MVHLNGVCLGIMYPAEQPLRLSTEYAMAYAMVCSSATHGVAHELPHGGACVCAVGHAVVSNLL